MQALYYIHLYIMYTITVRRRRRRRPRSTALCIIRKLTNQKQKRGANYYTLAGHYQTVKRTRWHGGGEAFKSTRSKFSANLATVRKSFSAPPVPNRPPPTPPALVNGLNPTTLCFTCGP